jgi:hypothetical protein
VGRRLWKIALYFFRAEGHAGVGARPSQSHLKAKMPFFGQKELTRIALVRVS